MTVHIIENDDSPAPEPPFPEHLVPFREAIIALSQRMYGSWADYEKACGEVAARIHACGIKDGKIAQARFQIEERIFRGNYFEREESKGLPLDTGDPRE